MNKIFSIVSLFLIFAMLPVYADAAGRSKSKVINDEWEEDWETTFFEKEAVKKQILKKERPNVVPRTKIKVEPKPPKSLYTVEQPAPEPEPKSEEEEYYDSLIAAKEQQNRQQENAAPVFSQYSSLQNDNASYIALKMFNGNLTGSESGNAYGMELAFGIKRKALRTEADFLYNFPTEEFNAHNYKFSSFALMFNIFADLNITGTPELTPYMGFGAGVSDVSLKEKYSHWHGSGVAFAWQAAAGMAYSFNSNFAIDFGYRLLNYGSPRIKKVDYTFESKQFMMGAKFFF